jgi:DNA end-binding protein Ku
MLNLLRYQAELRDPSEFDLPAGGLEKHGLSSKEAAMAEKFVESLSADWEPEKYKDHYRDALMKWIQEKIKAGEKAVPPASEEEEGRPAASAPDIMELLRRSMEKVPQGRRRSSSSHAGKK